MSGLEFSARIARVKDDLDFGDVADALGLSGSSRAGWDCPACGAPRGVKERRDRRGARCRSCDRGYDLLGLTTVAETLTAMQGLARLEEIAAALNGSDTDDLFSNPEGEADA